MFSKRNRPFLNFIVAAAAVLSAAGALTACGKKEVGFDTLDSARKQAKENAEFNARAWRAQLPVMAQQSLISRGDSSQTPECPQGDGWASIDVVNPNTAAVVAKLKCSTVSDSVGCRTDNDFKGSPYSSEDGHCAPTSKVPFPLPKIAK